MKSGQAFAEEIRINMEGMLREHYVVAVEQAVADEIKNTKSEQSARSGGIAPQVGFIAVDGKRGSPIREIRLGGSVFIDWSYTQEAAIKTIEYLRTAGPKESGDWRKSVACMVNGHEVDPHTIAHDISEVLIVIGVPYARRLEVGKTNAGRSFSIQVESHFVEHVAMEMNRKCRDLATFKFQYVDLSDAHQLTEKWQQKRKMTAKGMKFTNSKQANDKVRYPAIRINEIQAYG
jgi:hypothetical protein